MMMRSIGNFAGGCNVQFAVSPDEKEDIVAIEINPRVSRSSAFGIKSNRLSNCEDCFETGFRIQSG